ncbi:MAG: hypothetical protein Q7S66_04375 [bacterium]|nr:hypothetical protein [bacterium]
MTIEVGRAAAVRLILEAAIGHDGPKPEDLFNQNEIWEMKHNTSYLNQAARHIRAFRANYTWNGIIRQPVDSQTNNGQGETDMPTTFRYFRRDQLAAGKHQATTAALAVA